MKPISKRMRRVLHDVERSGAVLQTSCGWCACDEEPYDLSESDFHRAVSVFALVRRGMLTATRSGLKTRNWPDGQPCHVERAI